MKTAGQDFLEWYNYYVKKYGCSPSDYDVNYFWNGGNLEKEKQQIMDARIDGVTKSLALPPSYSIKNAEEYYKNTYIDSNQAGI